MKKSIINEFMFKKHHAKQIESRSQRDIFFIWMILIFISVIAAHFVLNFTASSPTGFITAAQNPDANTTLLFAAFLVVFIVILITGLVYTGITQKDHF